jgi:hypothetical protein
MDSSNFNNYKNGRNYQYIGGLATRSPIKFQIPRSGNWYVAVDMRGLKGTIKSSARLIPGPLQPLIQNPLSSIPPLIGNPVSTIPSIMNNRPFTHDKNFNPEYDVFISHASEDKEEIVRPLTLALKENEINVWFDEFELRIGDSLRRKIDQGLGNSKFGVVVLSKNFFKKNWTIYELDGMTTRAVIGDQLILPIWHNISEEEVRAFSPSLADKVAMSTSKYTIQGIADEITKLVKET